MMVSKPLTDLPHDILLKILSHAASNSVDDLFNFQRTCKSLHQAGSQPSVLRNAAVLDKLHAVRTRTPNPNQEQVDRAFRFLADCSDKGNPEALFFRGVEDLVYRQNKGDGRKLCAAAANRYFAAKYFFWVFVLAVGAQVEVAMENLNMARLGDVRGYARATVKAAIDCLSPEKFDWSTARVLQVKAGVPMSGGCVVRPGVDGLSDACFWQETSEVMQRLKSLADVRVENGSAEEKIELS